MFRGFARLHVGFAAAATAMVTGSLNSHEYDAKIDRGSRVWRILFTGGPCGGKSTALSTAQEFLLNHGFIVYTIPESSTVLRLGGVIPSYHTLNTFQNVVTSLQTNFENLYYYYAQNVSILYEKPVIILIDRGILDGQAYIENDKEFCNVLQVAGHNIDINKAEIDQNYNQILDRYDLVLHLVSASKGAPKFYKKEIYRHESLHDAIELDDKLVSIYNKHTNRRIIYNDLTFDEKIHSIIAHIADFLNIPNVIRKPLKYLIKIKDIDLDKYLRNDDIDTIVYNIKKCLAKESDADYVQIMSVTKTFLNLSQQKENSKIFIRETILLSQHDKENEEKYVEVFDEENIDKNYMLIESSEEFGQKMHKSIQLDKQRYDEYKIFNINKKLKQIQSVKLSFYYRGTYFSLCIFKEPKNAQNLIILKVYRAAGKKCVDSEGNLIIDLPECIVANKNVTNDRNHTSYGIASGKI